MEQLIDFHAPEVQAVLDTLLKDRSTGKNIIWANAPAEALGPGRSEDQARQNETILHD